MSKFSRERRIRNLAKRLDRLETLAKICKGVSGGYCCTYPGDLYGSGHSINGIIMDVSSTEQCYNHSAIAKSRYEHLKSTLKKLESIK